VVTPEAHVNDSRLLDLVRPANWVNPRPKRRYNLVVIGAGAGGLVSAAVAAGLGAQVALVESNLLGGDCLNVGCVPSKALLQAARVAASARRGAEFGVNVKEVDVDFSAVMERMRRLRADIARSDSAQRFTALGVDVFLGRGEFTGRNALRVEGETLTFARAILATGSRPHIPAIPGLSAAPYLTNESIFDLTRLPKRLGVLGAGPVGMELAQAFQRFGSQVTVIDRGTVLRGADPDAARVVVRSLQRDGVVFEHCDEVRAVRGTGVVLRERGGERGLDFDALLVATGRKPTVHGLGLDVAGIAFDEEAGIKVNGRLRTTNPAIYAIGDVASRRRFTHLSDFMARMAVRNALFFGRRRASTLLVPSVTYTDPEIAHVGADGGGEEVSTVTRELKDVDRAILGGDTEGFVKIHVRKGSDTILGATIVSSHAGDLIGEISVAMQAGMGLSKLAEVMHPYPTTADAIRQCGDLYNRTRLTPALQAVFRRLMTWRR
jgi:pyruvate/2-oxoglutarate dehydrogenase complex dihydrolipoamide dehydrogenase (E3) component